MAATRAILLALALALLVTAALAEPSHAYRLGGERWPTRTITYHSATPQYDEAIEAAATAWNASGARVRFKPVSRSRAKLRIVYGNKSGGPSGDAVLGFIRPTVVTWKSVGGIPLEGNVPCGARVPLPNGRLRPVRCRRERLTPRVRLDKVSATNARHPFYRLHMAITVAHELGHVLGLQHVTKPCSVMNYGREQRCPKPPEMWQLRCRLLEGDDVRGAIARYGGRLRRLAPEFCDAAPAAAPPSDLTARYDAAQDAIAITWRNATGVTLRAVRIAVTPDACATEPGGAFSLPAKRGAADSVTLARRGEPPGRYCVSVWSEDEYERAGTPVTAWVDVPAAEPAPDEPPPPDEP